jgi:alkylhydroperoxidase family enzyme
MPRKTPRRYPSQPRHVTALKLRIPQRSRLDADLQKYFGLCDEKIGFLPNVLAAYSFDQAKLPRRQRAMLDFAHKLTTRSAEVGDADRARLRRAGCTDREIWDIAAVASFFNMTNRMATAIDMMPNEAYHALDR